MKRVETPLPGVVVIEGAAHADSRGFFKETYHREKFAELGVRDEFLQDDFSRSRRGVLRGLHYQLKHPQAKLCWVAEGEALDVAVDVRVGSPSFGKWFSVGLSAEKHNQIYIPPGFAHGFLAISDPVLFLYKCSDFYFPSDDFGVAWNDPDLAIARGISAPLMSEKDLRHPPLAEISREMLRRYQPR